MRNGIPIAGAVLLSLCLIGSAEARPGGVGVGASAGANVSAAHMNTRAGFSARANARGPAFTPPGWRHGRKVGWHGRSRPPGLR
jgi:hypothetical protein